MGDLDALLAKFAIGTLDVPAPPAGAIDPWTGTPILAVPTSPAPRLTPIEFDLPTLPSTDSTLAASTDSATAAPPVPASAATSIDVVAPTSGTPITREEVLELLEGLDATIYLMV